MLHSKKEEALLCVSLDFDSEYRGMLVTPHILGKVQGQIKEVCQLPCLLIGTREYLLYQGVVKMIVGNKCDLKERREVTTKQGQELSEQYGLKFMEVSAKASINVEEAFTTLVKDIRTMREAALVDQDP